MLANDFAKNLFHFFSLLALFCQSIFHSSSSLFHFKAINAPRGGRWSRRIARKWAVKWAWENWRTKRGKLGVKGGLKGKCFFKNVLG
jgi:hypothetical protein